VLDREAAARDRVQQAGERQVIDADTRTDPSALGIRRQELPALLPVAWAETDRDSFLAALDERRREARVHADVDERPAGTEHAMRLREHARRVVEVRVREDRDDGVERTVSEGQR